VGQRRPFTPREIQAIRYALEQENNARDLALFNTAIDTMLRASDLLALKVEDVTDHKVSTTQQRRHRRRRC
jgi:integrase